MYPLAGWSSTHECCGRLTIIEGLPQALHSLSVPKQDSRRECDAVVEQRRGALRKWARRGLLGIIEAKGVPGGAVGTAGAKKPRGDHMLGIYCRALQACPFRLLAGILIGNPLTLGCAAHNSLEQNRGSRHRIKCPAVYVRRWLLAGDTGWGPLYWDCLMNKNTCRCLYRHFTGGRGRGLLKRGQPTQICLGLRTDRGLCNNVNFSMPTRHHHTGDRRLLREKGASASNCHDRTDHRPGAERVPRGCPASGPQHQRGGVIRRAVSSKAYGTDTDNAE